MQAAEDGPRFDAPEDVNWSPRWRILVQGQVGSAPIVVGRITAQQMEKMALSQDNHVVQTVLSDWTDRPLAISVLPGWAGRGRPIPDAHRSDTAHKGVAVHLISIT